MIRLCNPRQTPENEGRAKLQPMVDNLRDSTHPVKYKHNVGAIR
jgi:hypothetical protein